MECEVPELQDLEDGSLGGENHRSDVSVDTPEDDDRQTLRQLRRTLLKSDNLSVQLLAHLIPSENRLRADQSAPDPATSSDQVRPEILVYLPSVPSSPTDLASAYVIQGRTHLETEQSDGPDFAGDITTAERVLRDFQERLSSQLGLDISLHVSNALRYLADQLAAESPHEGSPPEPPPREREAKRNFTLAPRPYRPSSLPTQGARLAIASNHLRF